MSKRNKGARDFQLWKSCQRKRRYNTEAEAYQKGQSTYHCKHCNGWHRSGALATLISRLTKQK
jgi:hypothetical protein